MFSKAMLFIVGTFGLRLLIQGIFTQMRQKFMTIWNILLLVPYLSFAVIGQLPHQHNHQHIYQHEHQLNSTPVTSLCAHLASPNDSSLFSIQRNKGVDGSHCPICIIQAALSTCASISQPQFRFPVAQITETSASSHLLSRVLPALHSSRAPPPLLG